MRRYFFSNLLDSPATKISSSTSITCPVLVKQVDISHKYAGYLFLLLAWIVSKRTACNVRFFAKIRTNCMKFFGSFVIAGNGNEYYQITTPSPTSSAMVLIGRLHLSHYTNELMDAYFKMVWDRQGLREVVREVKGVRKRGLGLNPPTWAWYFTKSLLPAQRKLNVFAYFLLVNLST